MSSNLTLELIRFIKKVFALACKSQNLLNALELRCQAETIPEKNGKSISTGNDYGRLGDK